MYPAVDSLYPVPTQSHVTERRALMVHEKRQPYQHKVVTRAQHEFGRDVQVRSVRSMSHLLMCWCLVSVCMFVCVLVRWCLGYMCMFAHVDVLISCHVCMLSRDVCMLFMCLFCVYVVMCLVFVYVITCSLLRVWTGPPPPSRASHIAPRVTINTNTSCPPLHPHATHMCMMSHIHTIDSCTWNRESNRR